MSRIPLHPTHPHNHSHTYYPIQPSKPTSKPSKLQNPAPSQRFDISRNEVDKLRRENMQLRQREETYIQKLMKLEAGLEYQNCEFVKMQQLYTELFDSYKDKEAEIIELELRFRQTDRKNQNKLSHCQIQTDPEEFFAFDRPNYYSFKDMSLNEDQQEAREKQWNQKEIFWEDREKQLIQQIENLKEKIQNNNLAFEKAIQEVKSKEKAANSKLNSEKLLHNINELTEKLNTQHENRLKLQYQNEFLKARNTDLQEHRAELERLITQKQQEIGKLRQEKIKLHRQGSQKFLDTSRRSPASPLSKKGSQVELMAHSGVSSSSESGFNQYFSFSGQGSGAQGQLLTE